MQAFWWIMAGVSVAIYVVLAAVVLPKVFFSVAHEGAFSKDRGLKNYRQKNGRTVVYQPKLQYRKYVSQYIISQKNGIKNIICKLDESIGYVDMDVVLFNERGRAFKVINIKEKTQNRGYTSEAELPEQTFYATLTVNIVDNMRVNNGSAKILSASTALFSACVCALTFAAVFLIKLCFAGLFADVFDYDFMTTAQSTIITVAVALLITFVNIAAVLIHVKLKNKRRRGYGV